MRDERAHTHTRANDERTHTHTNREYNTFSVECVAEGVHETSARTIPPTRTSANNAAITYGGITARALCPSGNDDDAEDDQDAWLGWTRRCAVARIER